VGIIWRFDFQLRFAKILAETKFYG